MIRDSVLLHAPSGTGKTTFLQAVWDRDHHADLAVNLNRSYDQIKHRQRGFRTRSYLVTPDQKTPAMALTSSPLRWAYQIADFKRRRPVIHHLLIDEVQCAEPVYLTQLIQLVRGIYQRPVPVIMCGLMYRRSAGRLQILPQVKGLAKITEHVIRFRRDLKPWLWQLIE